MFRYLLFDALKQLFKVVMIFIHAAFINKIEVHIPKIREKLATYRWFCIFYNFLYPKLS